MSFCHLHVHNEFSLLDGMGSAEDYAIKAKELGQEYLALTNHGNIDGLLKFQKACLKQDIKPILGCEVYLVKDLSIKEKGEKRNHLTLLIKNEQGFRNLCKMLTVANLEGFYYKPRVDFDLLYNHCDGLVVLSGCAVGLLSMEGDRSELVFDLWSRLKKDFYIEVMPHDFKEQKKVNKEALLIAEDLHLPIVVTNDCHYVNADDSESHEVLLAMQTQAKWDDKNRFRFNTRGLFLCSEKQMRHKLVKQGVLSLKQIDEAIDNTIKIAKKCCEFRIEKQSIFLPAVPKYNDKDPYKLLLGITRRRLQELISASELSHDDVKIYRDRLSEEWKLIQRKGFTPYFCIVKELVDWCKEKDIMIGSGRGSVGGSLVAYLLGITCVDPIKYNLLFSRFINEDRNDLPDIDLDFEDIKREQVKEHLKQLYGENNIASISTFLTMKGKAVVRDVARVFDVPLKEVDEFAKNISYYEEGDVIAAACKTEIGKKFAKQYPKIINHAIKLEGLMKSTGQHAAACIISADDLTQGAKGNLAIRKDQLVSNWDMEDSEHMGLMKLDVLGLNTLTVLHECAKEIYKNHNKQIDFTKLPLDSKKVYHQISQGQNVGIFQISGWATNNLAPQIQPKDIFGLSDLVALSRPGTLDSGMTDLYIERLQTGQWERKHPVYEKITKNTKGIIVYQEQVMEVIYKIAGLPYSIADKIRKIIAKKRDAKEFQQYEDIFIKGCLKQGYFNKQEALEFWEMLQAHASYCLTGDTIVYRGSQNSFCDREITINQLYEKQKYYNFRHYGYKILSLCDDGLIRPRKLKAIYKNGRQRVFCIKTTSNKSIKATANHRFFVNRKWRMVKDIKIGDLIQTTDFLIPKLNAKGNGKGPFIRGFYPQFEIITDIFFVGERETYDIEMEAEPRNFIANGFVSHNSFNKSHSLSYAIMAYWTAWVRCFYPVEFICALLNYGSDNDQKKKEYMEEARRLDLDIRLPSLKYSDPMKWIVKQEMLYVPLIEIKGVGEKLIAKCSIEQSSSPQQKTKGMKAFFDIETDKKLFAGLDKEPKNKLHTIINKLIELEKEGNHQELQKYFTFNIL